MNRIVWLLVAFAALSGCESYDLADGLPELQGVLCGDCHGSSQNAAPPEDTQGNTATSEPGVGAHQSHLRDGKISAAVECSECHLVPASLLAVGHMDALPAELIWGPLATAENTTPTYDGSSCSETYCHGATLPPGGTNTSPIWTQVDGTQAACGTCHGNPPPRPTHPKLTNCHHCHPNTVTPAEEVDVAGGFHMDGKRDAAGTACDVCHGADGNPAPPVDLHDHTATTEAGVGAHREHLGPSSWHAEITCGECHLVPAQMTDPGHVDTPLPAELTWGPLSTAGGTTPSFDQTINACSAVYCHGATLRYGGINTTPIWTKVDGTQAQCGNCHSLPPSEGHPLRTDCETCHNQVVDAARNFIAPDLHINGSVDVVTLACDACHGSNGDPAPPVDVQGNTGTSNPGVGAHREHQGPSNWHAEIACDECHLVPTATAELGHADTALPAELFFGPLALADGAQPGYDGATTTCSGSYCHGSTLDGTGGNRTPNWTKVGQGEIVCDSCHGLPPELPHIQLNTCELCHECVVDENQNILPENSYLHINGVNNNEQLGSCPPP
jgi:predicted CxxxxCH...CXXCH cytochrome family protein